MNKKFIAVLSFVFISLFFQTSSLLAEEEVIFGGKLENGGYGGPHISIGQLNDEIGFFVGGRGGWIIDHSFSVGFSGSGLVSNNRIKNYSQEVSRWGYDSVGYYHQIKTMDSSWYMSDFGYGGLLLEYIYNSNEIFHFTGSLLIGGGHLAYNNEPISMRHNNNYIMYDGYNYEFDKKSTDFFVLEPAVSLELNVTKWFRIDAGVSYRIVSGVDMPQTTNSQVSGLSGNLILKFGKF
jgi:hypothetical protein